MAFVTEQVEKLQTKLGLNRTNSIVQGNNYLFNKKDLMLNIKSKMTDISIYH